MQLPDSYRQIVTRLAREHMGPTVELWAYGSRVTGRAHDTSDLDLAVRRSDGGPVDPERLGRFRTALEDSDLPIFVDAHDWACLPPSFLPAIEREHEVLG